MIKFVIIVSIVAIVLFFLVIKIWKKERRATKNVEKVARVFENLSEEKKVIVGADLAGLLDHGHKLPNNPRRDSD